MGRALVSFRVTDVEGVVQPYARVTLYEINGTTLLVQPLYVANTGSTTVSNPLQSDQFGLAVAYADTPQRAVATVGTYATVFDIEDDPGDLFSLPVALSSLAPPTVNRVLTSDGAVVSGTLIVNANIDPAAAIALTKIASSTIGVIRSDGSALSSFAVGTAYQDLATNAAANGLQWLPSLQSLMTAGGDILQAASANTPARLAIGTARQQLIVNSGATALQYAASLQSLMTAQGDIPYASAANTPTVLPKGTGAQQFRMNAGATAPEWFTPTVCSIRHSAAQSIANTTATALIFDTEIEDPDNLHDNVTNNSRITIAVTGQYDLRASAAFASNATGYRTLSLRINGGLVAIGNTPAVTGDDTYVSISKRVSVSVGSYVEVFGYQNSGGALNTVAASPYTPWLQVTRVS